MEQSQHLTLQTPRGEVHYWLSRHDDPAAPALVLLHGLTAEHTMFQPQWEFFRARCTLLAPDAPLHGASRPYRDFSYRAAGEEVVEMLAREGIERAVFVGMSAGGYLAQAAIACCPERAAAFVGIDTSPLDPSFYPVGDLFWTRQAARLARLMPDRLLRRTLVRNSCASDSAARKMEDMLAPFGRDVLCAQMEAFYGALGEWEGPAALPCPVRLLLGQFDRLGNVRRYNVDWAQKGGYELTIVPSAGHFSNWDNPGVVNRAIAALLDTLARGLQQ